MTDNQLSLRDVIRAERSLDKKQKLFIGCFVVSNAGALGSLLISYAIASPDPIAKSILIAFAGGWIVSMGYFMDKLLSVGRDINRVSKIIDRMIKEKTDAVPLEQVVEKRPKRFQAFFGFRKEAATLRSSPS
jgi:hypothetical protein